MENLQKQKESTNNEKIYKKDFGDVKSEKYPNLNIGLSIFGTIFAVIVFWFSHETTMTQKIATLENEIFQRHETIEQMRDSHNATIHELQSEIAILKNKIDILKSEARIFRISCEQTQKESL